MTPLRSTVLAIVASMPAWASAVTIDFDDVSGDEQDITTRYAVQGVTLNAIENAFPLVGAFPAPATLPAVLGGAQTWIEGFASATSGSQVAVSMQTATTGQPGNGGLLLSFAFDVDHVSLVGNDLGGCPAAPGSGDCEAVTLTAYNAAGNRIGQVFSTTKLSGSDRTFAEITLPGMRYVAYNYTNTAFGFYAIDDLTFLPSVPEPQTWALLAAGLLVLTATRSAARRRA